MTKTRLPHYWPSVRGMHRWIPLRKGQWFETFILFIYFWVLAWTSCWTMVRLSFDFLRSKLLNSINWLGIWEVTKLTSWNVFFTTGALLCRYSPSYESCIRFALSCVLLWFDAPRLFTSILQGYFCGIVGGSDCPSEGCYICIKLYRDHFLYAPSQLEIAIHCNAGSHPLGAYTEWSMCIGHINPLQWRHNGCDGVSNHQPHGCLLSRLFNAQIKENIKVPHHWPLCGEFTGDRWIPRTKGQ